jgi:hypothetical protein
MRNSPAGAAWGDAVRSADDILIAEIRAVPVRVEQHANDLLKMVQSLDLFTSGGVNRPPPPANDDATN